MPPSLAMLHFKLEKLMLYDTHRIITDTEQKQIKYRQRIFIQLGGGKVASAPCCQYADGAISLISLCSNQFDIHQLVDAKSIQILSLILISL